MVRVPLEELVLQIHLLDLGRAAAFLETVLQPPPEAAVAGALATLRDVGALTADEQLTPLGGLFVSGTTPESVFVGLRLTSKLLCFVVRVVKHSQGLTGDAMARSTCRQTPFLKLHHCTEWRSR